jgi:hypothetical protein
MKKISIALLLIIAIGCNNPGVSTDVQKDTLLVNLDTVPELRTVINPNAVAIYHEKIPDELNNWGFDIKVYETGKTFYYLMKIKYEEMDALDTLKIPNIGIRPVIELHRGDEKNSCIVGFKDKLQQFRVYKKVSIQNNRLSIKTLAHYGVFNTVK